MFRFLQCFLVNFTPIIGLENGKFSIDHAYSAWPLNDCAYIVCTFYMFQLSANKN